MATSARTHNTPLTTLHTRALQLTTTLSALQRDLQLSDPFPPWAALQNSLHLATRQLIELSTVISQNTAWLEASHVYPLADFEGVGHQGMMEMLLRKRLEPGVEAWMDGGVSRLREESGDGVKGGKKGGRDLGELEERWDWAAVKARDLFRGVVFDIDFTMEEREGEGGVESVRTGVRRRLRRWGDEEDGGESEEDEDDGDAQMGDVQKDGADGGRDGGGEKRKATRPPLKLEDVHRFMSTGILPRRVFGLS